MKVQETKYDWLRANNWQEVLDDGNKLEPKIKDWLVNENNLSNKYFADTKDLQKKIVKEIRGRIKEEDQSLPTYDGEYAYLSKFELGAQYQKVIRTKRDGSEEYILFDFDEMGKNYKYFSVGGVNHSDDHKTIAYSIDIDGNEEYKVYFKDGFTDKKFDDVLLKTTGSVIFNNKGDFVYYIKYNENHKANKVFKHKFGTPQSEDILIYEEEDKGYFLSIFKSDDDKYIFIDSHDHISSEIKYFETETGDQDIKYISKREEGVEYDVSHRDGYFYISTNIDGAVDFKIVKLKVGDDLSKYENFIEHKPGTLQCGLCVFKNHMVRIEKTNALPQIIIHCFKTGEEKFIKFEDEAYSIGIGGVMEYENPIMRYSYSSPCRPSTVFEINLDTMDTKLMKEQEIPSGFEKDNYIVKRLYAKSHDGVNIPLTIFMKKNINLDGNNPVLLYGYGSYGNSATNGFSSNIISLVDRGFIYATTHIRGGMDLGYEWYTSGKKLNKKNTFYDFISCAEKLISDNYTSSGLITSMGGSAGGMLVGACVNMRPELFKCVVGLVPFVDVLATICDETLPLTVPEWNEWGNPTTSQEVFDYIKSYSPFDNIEAKNYPSMYIEAGLSDPRVTYWEPAKYVAKMKDLNVNKEANIVLRTNMDCGHAGTTGRFNHIDELAEIYAFILKENGKANN